jgi:PHD/YefM family antitoxin component YafN of YafNO toxin-antitoxin module
VYTFRVRVPEVLSVREFRAGLAATLKRLQDEPDVAVFVGAHRRAEAVVMSVSQYEQLAEAAARSEAMREALASVRAEGLEPSPEGLQLLDAIVAGQLSSDEVRARILARYAR